MACRPTRVLEYENHSSVLEDSTSEAFKSAVREVLTRTSTSRVARAYHAWPATANVRVDSVCRYVTSEARYWVAWKTSDELAARRKYRVHRVPTRVRPRVLAVSSRYCTRVYGDEYQRTGK